MSGTDRTTVAGALRCPVCEARDMMPFFEMARAPVACNVLWDSPEAAAAVPRAPIRLGCCRVCGMVENICFDPDLMEYTPRYENSLHYSAGFAAYARDLAEELVWRYDLHGREVVEIGCGQGEFLALLAQAGVGRAVGYDPSYDPARAAGGSAGAATVTIHRRVYLPAETAARADLICCRQVLEHIPQPLAFLRSLRATMGPGPGPTVFFEVPNALYTLRDMGIWDILYEHCSYFTAPALRRLFERARFEVLDVRQRYGGQFLSLEARPAADGQAVDVGEAAGADEVVELAGRFGDSWQRKTDIWRRRLERLEQRGRHAAVWGGGTKGTMFLNALDVPSEQVPHVVDLNPHKQGRYVSGTGQRIVAPEQLRRCPPDVVIVMNGLYETEIVRALQAMHLRCPTPVA